MAEAAGTCPFSQREGWFSTVKDLEKRWGLTLVSFLPRGAQGRIRSLQEALSAFSGLSRPPADPEVEFYAPGHLHCTHLTLTRSSAWGPVREQDFVRPSHELFELFGVIHENSCRMAPMAVSLDNLKMSPDGLSLVLTGKCSGDRSKEDRGRLLRSLNTELPPRFQVSMRSWDRRESEFHKLHCRIAFLKRPLETHSAFLDVFQGLAEQFRAISFPFEALTLAHHRYRSLEPPQEGEFDFPLGRDIRAETSAAVFASGINLR